MQETQEMWIPSPGWEDPLEEERATNSSILVWEISWTVGYSPWGLKQSDKTEPHTDSQRYVRTHTHTHTHDQYDNLLLINRNKIPQKENLFPVFSLREVYLAA